MSEDDRDRRWRLALGGEDEALGPADQRLSAALTRSMARARARQKTRAASAARRPCVARWMSDIRRYFPGLRRPDRAEGRVRAARPAAHAAGAGIPCGGRGRHEPGRHAWSRSQRDSRKDQAHRAAVIAKVVAALIERLERKTAEALARRRRQVAPHLAADVCRYRLATHHPRQSSALPGRASRPSCRSGWSASCGSSARRSTSTRSCSVRRPVRLDGPLGGLRLDLRRRDGLAAGGEDKAGLLRHRSCST